MARRRSNRPLNPYLIVGLIAGAVIIVMGFLILSRNRANFGEKRTDPALSGRLTSTSGSTGGPGTGGTAVDVTSKPADGTRSANVSVPAPQPVTAAPQQQESPVVIQEPADVPDEPAPPPVEDPDPEPEPEPEPEPDPEPEPEPEQPQDQLKPVELPFSFGRIDPASETRVIPNATLDRFQGPYSGTMIISQSQLDLLPASDAIRARIEGILNIEGIAYDVAGRLEGSNLSIVSEESPLSINGYIRRLTLNIEEGESYHPSVDPYIPGAEAQIRVYLLPENVINYVYSERVTADADTLAWLEVRIELVGTY
jgi:hypothetical protein